MLEMRKESSGDEPNDRPFTSVIQAWPYAGKQVGAMRAYGSDWGLRALYEIEADHRDIKTRYVRTVLCGKYRADWPRRLLGLWILFTTSWFAAWGAYTMSTCSLESVRERPPGPLSTMCQIDFSGWATQYHYLTIWDYATLVVSGITVPIGILALSLSIFLMGRAFRSHWR
jgi:hypothetical protein